MSALVAHASTIDSTTAPAYSNGSVAGFDKSTSSTVSFNYTVGSYNNTFTTTFTLDPEALAAVIGQEDAGRLVLASVATAGTNNYVGMNWTLVASSTGISLYDESYTAAATTTNDAHNVSTATGNGLTNVNLSTGLTGDNAIDWTSVSKAALTMDQTNPRNGGDIGTVLVLTLTKTDGTTVSYGGENKNFRVTSANYAPSTLTINSDAVISAYMFDNETQGDYATRIALNVAASEQIPEPTTATLSLLALAGLAARRRRK